MDNGITRGAACPQAQRSKAWFRVATEKADALLQYRTEPNLFIKALHYREALAAAENYSFMAHYHNVHEKAETSILQDESSFLPRELFGQRRMVACLLIIDKSCSDLPPFVHL
jgi:hypothetical protein